jgi:RNA polymerase sigma-70 factor (ECF subfamily)
VDGDDLTLLTSWREGNARAGQALVERHFDAMYRFFANKLGSDVEDLIQETFTACVENRDKFREQSSFRTYLFAIARNKLYRYWRDRRPEMRDEASVQDLAESAVSPADALVAHQEQRLLLRALRTLPLPTQVLLELAYFENFSDREAAEIVGMPVGTLKSRLRRGRQLLLEAMEGSGERALALSTMQGFDGWVSSMRGRWQAAKA